ncbi:helix-turn-helix transcriptional regulator [Parafrankia elaeagni]|uniref:helix-turn-helix transcriptional regulator n=1 Tax=Parafrankia elaeagni TaxID=222534 RepID=UPI00036B4B97|nr:WYL domain-containing protein [Parafrankia elaeagni]
MNRTDRLYAIVEQLRAAGPAGRTGRQLAQRFEVSERTIKRDVTALQDGGVPIWAQSGPGGGYVLDGGATMPPLNITAAEATAIALALAAVPALPFAPDGRSALAKVLAAMPVTERRRARDLGSRLWMRRQIADVRPALARTLDEALRRRVVVVLDYVDREGRTSTRRAVEPVVFAATGGHWYLLAWCRTRRAGRWFRLDRVRGATLTREQVAPRDMVETFGEPPADARPVHVD